MERKKYQVTVSVPRGVSEFAILLTDGEADTVRYFAEQLETAASTYGYIDYIEITEAGE